MHKHVCCDEDIWDELFGLLSSMKKLYVEKVMNGGMKGVAFVEADTEQWAIKTFMEQYAGQYFTIETVTKIG